VLVVSCPPRDCRSREGPKWLEQRVFSGREAELKARVDRARVRVVYASRAEQARLSHEVASFRADLAWSAVPDAEQDIDLIALCERPEAEEVGA